MRKNQKLFKQNILLIAGLAVAVILIILVIIDLNKKIVIIAPTPSLSVKNTQPSLDDKSVIPATTTAFRTDVPANVSVPETTTKQQDLKDKQIVIPSLVVAAAPGVDNKYRLFKIAAEKDVYNPSKVIANMGDTVHIDFTAVDKDYDFVFPSYNMVQRAKKGQTKVIEFQALQTGDFIYYCNSCGGVNTKTKGHVIIVKP